MKTLSKRLLLNTLLSLVLFAACASTGFAPGNSTLLGSGTEISAQGSLGRMEAVPSDPLYTGDGGKNIRLAVLAPETQGNVPAYLPIYIQGLLNNNFSRYSSISLIDRQNLDRIISEQNIAASGIYSDRDFITIGNLTNTQYFLFGTIQRLSGERYSLQLSITDSATGVRRANFMMDGSLAQLEGRGTLINEASADLLTQMGVALTESGKQTLLDGNTSVARAEAGLARGITAQAGGEELEALFNFTQAITFDPSQLEALSRLNMLSTDISGGTISQRIVNDIQARNRWLEVFRETTRFFNDHPPFEITFDPNLVQIGQTDYVRSTANIGMRIALDPSEAGFAALNTLLEGLDKTGMRDVWGFSGWPLLDITPRTAGTVVFNGRPSFNFKVDVALLNEENKTLANSSINLTTEIKGFFAGNIRISLPSGDLETVNFSNVRAEDLTPSLIIVIVAVNGISSRDLSDSGYMRIVTGDLDERWQRREAALAMDARAAEREAATAASVAARRREAFFALAKRNNVEFISLYYKWEQGNTEKYIVGITPGGIYKSLVPFTTIGVEGRLGWCNEIGRFKSKDEEYLALEFGVAPLVGFVFPIGNRVLLFSDFLLEISFSSNWYYNGLITEWLNPGFDAGATYKLGKFNITSKYRGMFYAGKYSHAVAAGLGYSFW